MDAQSTEAQSEFEAIVTEVVTQVRPYTMVPEGAVGFIVNAVKHIVDNNVEGDFVECGVWQGGCSAAMVLANLALQPAKQRLMHMFDSYEGLPPAKPEDGPLALLWQSSVNSPTYYDNCAASLELVQQNFATLGIAEQNIQFHKGWFDQTIPHFAQNNSDSKISLLRLDGDWYESTKVCLENLYPLVSEGGIVIIDDYYSWDGCALAVHEYLGLHKLSHRIITVSDVSSAYFVKRKHRIK